MMPRPTKSIKKERKGSVDRGVQKTAALGGRGGGEPGSGGKEVLMQMASRDGAEEAGIPQSSPISSQSGDSSRMDKKKTGWLSRLSPWGNQDSRASSAEKVLKGKGGSRAGSGGPPQGKTPELRKAGSVGQWRGMDSPSPIPAGKEGDSALDRQDPESSSAAAAGNKARAGAKRGEPMQLGLLDDETPSNGGGAHNKDRRGRRSSLSGTDSFKVSAERPPPTLRRMQSDTEFIQSKPPRRMLSPPGRLTGDPDHSSTLRSVSRGKLLLRGGGSLGSLRLDGVGSSPLHNLKTFGAAVRPACSLLSGYDADAAQPKLRYGDCISLVPDGLNGVVAHSEGKGWVEILSNEVCVPPNVRDCRFRIIPRMHHTEGKVVKKLLKAGVWDDGKRLPPPELPQGPHTANALSQLATAFARKHNILSTKGVSAMFRAVAAARVEREDNENEILRQNGTPLRFGDYVQLQHHASNRMITISKSQSIQRGGHLIEFDPLGGGEASVFEIQPAYRIISQGELVSSGDLVVFRSMKKFEGGKCFLDISSMSDSNRSTRTHMGRVRRKSMDLGGAHMSRAEALSVSRADILESLRCDSPYILAGEELIASSNPTFWRTLLFSSHDASANAEWCGDSHVGLYHKDAESYLCYDPLISTRPLFMSSSRVSLKARKKSSWIWKIEHSSLVRAGEALECGEKGIAGYRLMHLATGLYLCADGNQLRMSESYDSDATLFTFKSLARALGDDSSADRVLSHTLVYVRSKSEGGWLTQGKKVEKSINTPKTPTLTMSTVGTGQEKHVVVASLRGHGNPSERDALRFLSVRDIDVNGVVEMRHLKRSLTKCKESLEQLPDCDPGDDQNSCPSGDGRNPSDDNSASEREDTDVDVNSPTKQTKSKPIKFALLDDVDFEDVPLPEGTQRVMGVVDKWCRSVNDGVTKLLLQVTVDDDPDPLTRDGAPDVFVQKLLREMMIVQDLVSLVEVPLRKGLNTEMLMDERTIQLQDMMGLVFRLLKQSVKKNEKNARIILSHVNSFHRFLGKGIAAMEVLPKPSEWEIQHLSLDPVTPTGVPVITEMYKGNRELLCKIEEDEVRKYIQHMHHEQGHIKTSTVRCALFLSSMCGCDGQPISKNQEQICRLLFDPSRASCLPRLRVALEMDKPGSGGPTDADPMAALAAMMPRLQVRRRKGFIDVAAVMAEEMAGQALVGKLYADLVGKDGEVMVTLDFSEYLEQVQSGGMSTERCEHVLGQRIGRLQEKDLLMVYVVRCIELFCELALGRNQTSFNTILRNKNFSLDYSQILLVMFSRSVPISVRACYVKLMQRLYVDRDPQSSMPDVLFTRAWKKVWTSDSGVQARVQMFRRDAREQMLATKKLGNTEVLPVCMTGFEDLILLVLKELPLLGKEQIPEQIDPELAHKVTPTLKEAVRRFTGRNLQSTLIGTSGTVGQISFVRELVALIGMLMDFHVIASERGQLSCNYDAVQKINDVMFQIIDVSGEGGGSAGRRGMELGRLRIEALEVLWRAFSLRINHRISQAVQMWEEIFEEMDPVEVLSIPKRNVSAPMTVTDVGYAQERTKLVHKLFESFESRLESLYSEMFKTNTVFSANISADIVPEPGSGTSLPVESLLALFCASSGSPDLAFMALKCTFRQVLQTSTALQSLRHVQLLAYEHAVRLNEETDKAVKKILGLRKHLHADKDEAYRSVVELMELLSSYITPSESLSRSLVAKNQTILLNKDIDGPVTSLLSLELKRTSSQGAFQPDIAVNSRRREMFQSIYHFLMLLAKGNKQAQEKLSHMIPVFMDHLGIHDLLVADTIGEIYRNNPTLLSQVKSRFLSRFIQLIHRHGRKARWLAIFKVFLQIEGKPFKRCQDLIVSLLIEDAELVIDLRCDYTNGANLAKKDWRIGMNRNELMRRNEHLAPYGSLLQYHVRCIEVLSMCASGKNPTPKALLHAFIPLRQIVLNIVGGTQTSITQAWRETDSFTRRFSSRGGVSKVPSTPPGSPQKPLQRTRTSSSGSKASASPKVRTESAVFSKIPSSLSSVMSMSQDSMSASCDGKNSSFEGRASSSNEDTIRRNKHAHRYIPEEVKAGPLGPEDEIDLDTVFLIKGPWVMLLTDVYLTTQEKSAIRNILHEPRFWGFSEATRASLRGERRTSTGFSRATSSTNFSRTRSKGSIMGGNHLDGCVLDEFLRVILLLKTRLEELGPQPRGVEASKLFDGHKDGYGQDLSKHLSYVHEIIRALGVIMGRKDLYSEVKHKGEIAATMADIRQAAQSCYPLLQRFRALQTCRLIAELDRDMSDWGIAGQELNAAESASRAASSNPHLREDAFVKGWFEMCERFTSLSLGFDTFDPRELHFQSTTELALLFGSRQVPGNFDLSALRHLLNFCNEKNVELSVKVTALRTVRAVLYMMPDSKVMTDAQRKLEIQHFMRNEPPSHRGSEELRSLQTLIASIGAVNTIVSNMSGNSNSSSASPATDDVLAALRLAVTMLDGGNVEVQDMLCSVLQQPASVNFFRVMSELLDMSLDSIKLERRRHKQQRAEADFGGEGNGALGNGLEPGEEAEEEGGEDWSESGNARGTVHFAYEVVRLIRRMCQGQHRALQDVLRRQPMNRESVDLYQETIKFLSGMEPVISSAIDRGEIMVPQAMLRSFLMLGDAMHGPNRTNQRSISNSSIFDVCDRVMTKVKLTFKGDASGASRKTDTGSDTDANMPSALNRIAKEGVRNIRGLLGAAKEGGERSRDDKANLTRTQLKSAVLTCLLAFLEGAQRDDEVPHKMLSTLHWGVFASQMDQCYKFLDNGRDGKLKALVEQEGLKHYFLMRNLHYYDTHGVLENHLRKFSASVSYFRARTGYIEIARKSMVERVFFQLPQICLPGKTLDKPFLEMFDARRDDVDTKSRQFLHNMVRILEREQRNAGIRESSLWWTVDRSEWICSMSFNISLFINVVLVLGGYAEGESAKEFGARVATYGSTTYDALFYHTVLPLTVRFVRHLTWVFVGCCSARVFAFFWAKYPLLVLDMNNRDVDRMGAKGARGEGVEVRRGESLYNVAQGADKAATFDGAKKGDKSATFHGVRKGSPGGDDPDWQRVFWRMAVHPSVVYESVFFACSVGAVVFDRPLLTVFGLFEMCFWSGSKTAIDAIRFNLHKMGQTMLLGLLVIYVWMVIGLSTLRGAHEPGTCSNMFQCLCTYIYRATRQDGVKDVLQEAIFPTNVADAIVGEGAFAWRLIWDISFWLLFVLILIAIISGIIIDAFSGMRDEQEQASEDMNNRCFVCNLDRSQLDQHAAGFEHHVSLEHDPRMYLFFLLYLKTRPTEMLTGQETHVKSCVWPSMSHSWIPREATLTLKDKGDDETEVSRTKAAVVKLEGVVETLAGHMSKMGQMLSNTNTAIDQVQETLLQLRGDTQELSVEMMQVQHRIALGLASHGGHTDEEEGGGSAVSQLKAEERRSSHSSEGGLEGDGGGGRDFL